MSGAGFRWAVSRVTLTADAKRFGMQVWYPFHVEGVTHDPPREPQPFSWSVPNLDDYDLGMAQMDDATRAAVDEFQTLRASFVR